ncbi:MAG: DUF3047 domain-containing protein [Candidatus Omnitrophota bacterium]|nr:DUF3047 domain-containing protein [Candidatus Omnitrophota bacterium]
MPAKFKITLVFAVLAALIICAACIFTPLGRWLGLRQPRMPQRKDLKGVAYFRFDNPDALRGWEEKIFKGRVIYSVKSGLSGSYLNAYSKDSASGLLYWIKFSPRENPMVNWKWKVSKFPETKRINQKKSGWLENDDYAARFYVIFPKFPFYRVRGLEYIWDKNMPEGTVLTNPNFTNLKIIVAESGAKNMGNWVQEERNIYEDYKKLFGAAPGNAGAIAIMTDSDNSQSSAEAQYNDIEVGYAKQ